MLLLNSQVAKRKWRNGTYRDTFQILTRDTGPILDEEACRLNIFYSVKGSVAVAVGDIDISTCKDMKSFRMQGRLK